MRQGQQNRRGRGRGGRKGQSPLSRSFESSGPDIKIRGTAQHIAEKYMALARDAIGSGDLVLGENYLQHAEHYNRIIMAAQTLPQNGYDQMNGNGQRIARPEGDPTPLDGMGDGYDGDDDGEAEQPGVNQGNYEQPRTFESSGQREHHHQQPQNRNRDGRNFDNRNYDNRNFDNRRNEPRSFEPRGQGGHDPRANQDSRANQDHRVSHEPRSPDSPRPTNPNGGEQPRSFEPPQAFPDNREVRPQSDGRPGEVAGPRGRRRRGRHENGSVRLYPPQVGQIEGAAEPMPDLDNRRNLPSEGNDGSDGNSNGGGDGQA